VSPDLFWIPGPWRGKLAIVTRPRGGDWLADEAFGWKQAGLDTIVSLLEAHEIEEFGLSLEAQAAAEAGVEFVSFPIPDQGIPDSLEAAQALLSELTEKLENGMDVAIHCRQSIGRSGLLAVSLLVSSGATLQSALNTASAVRNRKIPETAVQLNWLLHLDTSNSTVGLTSAS
jgi:protein-tyrosine phosphatase